MLKKKGLMTKTKTRSKYRWVIAGLIFFITLVNFIDRSAISFIRDQLKAEFHFNDTEFGLILSAFSVGYMVLTFVGGWLVDKMGTRVVWPLAAIGWSLCVALLGFATGFWSFIILRLALGVTEGPHFPAMSRSISNWLSSSERARALSLGLVAIPLSSVVGAPLTSYLVSDYGWRAMFFIVSSIGIVWGFVWFWLFRDRPEDSKYVNEAERLYISPPTIKKEDSQNIPKCWKSLLTHPVLIVNNISYFAFGYMLFFTTLWLPGYFLSQHGLNLKAVGWYLTIPWLAGAVFLKAGGILSDYLFKKTGKNRIARSHLIWGSQLLAGICFMILSFTNSLPMAILFLSLGIGFGLMPQSAFFSTNIDVAKEKAGTAQGITSGCLAFAGIVAPALTGWLVDITGNFQAAFMLLAGFTFISVVAVILFHHPDRKWTLRTSNY